MRFGCEFVEKFTNLAGKRERNSLLIVVTDPAMV